MFLKKDDYHRTGRLFFLCIILFLISFNVTTQLPRFIDEVRSFKKYQARPIGLEFTVLLPYLKNLQWVGYMTCMDSSHPFTDVAIMGPYQQAQSVLSPTLLDYFHPLDYRYIIYQCPHDAVQRQVQQQLSAYAILKDFGGGSLLYRKKDL